MKKVLVIITTAFTSTGGLSTVMLNYYRVIDKSKIRIDFCSTNKIERSLESELLANNSVYYQLPPRKNILMYFMDLKKLCVNYNIVHVNANSATAVIELQAAKQAGVNIRLIHNHTSQTNHPILNKMLLPLYRKSYTQAIACSEEAGKWLFGNHFTILRNAINPKQYAFNKDIRKQIRKSYEIKDEELVFGHVGKFMNAKNHLFLLRVFAMYHRHNKLSKLLLVGDGYLHKDIVDKIKQYQLENSVILTGLRRDVDQLLQAMDIFLFPSIYEGMPLSVIEAQASGLPCVISMNVTAKVCIGRDVDQLPLELGEFYWFQFVEKRKYTMNRIERCISNYDLITKAGYNIEKEGQNLMKFYNI